MSQPDLRSLRKSHYFHDGDPAHWDESPIGASFRVDASYAEKLVPDPVNSVFRFEEGQWILIEDAEEVPTVGRGLEWTIWKTIVGGKEFVACRGLLVVDKSVTLLLAELPVFAEDGSAQKDLLACGQTFLLELDDAKIFSQRVADIGGSIKRGSPAPSEITDAVRECRSIRDQFIDLKVLDDAALNLIRDNDMSELPEFEERGVTYRSLTKKLSQLLRSIDRAVDQLVASGVGRAEQREAEGLYERARELNKESLIVFEERGMAQREVSKIIHKRERKPKAVSSARQSENRLLISAIARMATDLGCDVKTVGDGAEITINDQILVITPNSIQIEAKDRV